jgi:hypothetical protein
MNTFSRNLLMACYELGHQPLNLAMPLAILRQSGLSAQVVDLAVESFPDQIAANSSFVGISVPMHTAMRLGVQAAQRVRYLNPDAHICFYGLYAWLNAQYLLSANHGEEHSLADSILAGEAEESLAQLVAAINSGGKINDVPGLVTESLPGEPLMTRLTFPMPDRSTLPTLDNYALFAQNGHQSLAGYVEATRGCLHECLHCPVVPIYNGRFFTVPAEVVLADIRQQVAAGARHITFGDPDFLNGPGHALKIVQAMHDEFPKLTFNFTTKVEHILEKRAIINELAHFGAAFMISAFESTSDVVLDRMQKGHSVADLDRALVIAEAAGLPIQPTWVPFTPWNNFEDYLDFLSWIESRGLVSHTPPIQYSIRLLIPPGSALALDKAAGEWLGELDRASFTYLWQHTDQRMDLLQSEVAQIAEEFSGRDYLAFDAIKGMAYGMIGKKPPIKNNGQWEKPAPPRLTEDWFC